MWPFDTSVRDARGRCVRLIGIPRRFLPWSAISDQSSRRKIEETVAARVRAQRLIRPTTIYFALVGPLFVGLIFVPFFFDLPFDWWFFMWVLPAVMIWGWARVLRNAMARDLVKAYVQAGLCASCGYKLETQIVSEDGCSICSECGAAWKVG